METAATTWHHDEYLYGAPLFPAAPLSWLAPLWCFACGVLASGGLTSNSGSLLRLPLGLLLAGPLLGTAWAGSAQLRHLRSNPDSPVQPSTPESIRSLPYTLPGSLGHRIATWVARAVASSQQSPLHKAVWRWLAGSLFSLAVAAQLGPVCLLLAALGLAGASILAWGRRDHSDSPLLSIALPLLLSWLLGHSAYGPLHVASALSAACFALTFSACASLERKEGEPGAQVALQAAAAAVLVAIKQPLLAAAIALLATPQLLLASLLTAPSGRGQYFAHIQWTLALSLLLSALALGA